MIRPALFFPSFINIEELFGCFFCLQTLVISESDIRKQEERVLAARLKLQEALRLL